MVRWVRRGYAVGVEVPAELLGLEDDLIDRREVQRVADEDAQRVHDLEEEEQAVLGAEVVEYDFGHLGAERLVTRAYVVAEESEHRADEEDRDHHAPVERRVGAHVFHRRADGEDHPDAFHREEADADEGGQAASLEQLRGRLVLAEERGAVERDGGDRGEDSHDRHQTDVREAGQTLDGHDAQRQEEGGQQVVALVVAQRGHLVLAEHEVQEVCGEDDRGDADRELRDDHGQRGHLAVLPAWSRGVYRRPPCTGPPPWAR